MSPDYDDDTVTGKRVLFVTLMPSFLPSLLKRFEEEGFRVKVFLFQGNNNRELHRLYTECAKADIIFCEFVQTPMETVVDCFPEKDIFARLWRCELYNPGTIKAVDWSKVRALFVPTESVELKFKQLRSGKPMPKNLVRFKAPAIDTELFPHHSRDFGKETFNIGILGNIIPRKRQFLAVQLMLSLPECFKLTIGGEFKDQEYVTHIRDFIQKNDLSDRVRLLGKIYPAAVPEFWNDCHIALGLSTEETGHFAVAEGMSTGAYPVMSYWWGCEDIFPSGNIHKSITDLVGDIVAWKLKPIKEKAVHSIGASTYIKTYLDSKNEDKNIVEYIRRECGT